MKNEIKIGLIAFMMAFTLNGYAEESEIERDEKALSLFYEQKENSPEEDHIPVGQRALPHSEWVKIQEEGAKKATLGVGDSLAARKMYYTSHQGAFHRPIAVTPLGEQVTLEDGSIWNVKWDHRHKTLDWLASDNILILPNHGWFSSYYYKLVNQNTGSEAEVNLFLGPIYNGLYTRWIMAIDYYNHEVFLDDGSVWKLASGDHHNFKKWAINDTVIIGFNDSWFSSYMNILLNVNMLNHASANCENGF